MFFNTTRKKAKELGHFLQKKWNYQRDILPENKLQKLEALIAELKALRSHPPERAQAEATLARIQKDAETLFPPQPGHDSWVENVEVIFVAVVLALALRTYVLQPFAIPTDSMKPTLWGIQTVPAPQAAPNVFHRITDLAVFGRSWHEVRAERAGEFRGLAQEPMFGVLPFKVTRILTSSGSYWVWATPEEVLKGAPHLLDASGPGRPTLRPVHFNAGDTIARFTKDRGDHVFVNKFIYHFRRPDPGEVFVFTTHGIDGINAENRLRGIDTNQFYIKRCVGEGGDVLEVRSPQLIRNGRVMDARPIFERIQSETQGYRGYGPGNHYLAPGETYTVPPDSYWAMGDNSYHSSDSRNWGRVPRENLVGTGLWVYWPFTQRWGLIR